VHFFSKLFDNEQRSELTLKMGCLSPHFNYQYWFCITPISSAQRYRPLDKCTCLSTKNSWRDWPCRYASANWSTTLFNSLIVLESDVAGFLNARFLNTHGTCADCRCRRKIKKIKDDLSDLCSPNCLHLRIHKSSFLRNRMSDSENLKYFLFLLNPSFKYYTF